jgi:hypothetical protein
VFPEAPWEREFRANLARLSTGDKNHIVAKDTVSYVNEHVSNKFIALVNIARILMEYRGIKTLNEDTTTLAIFLANTENNYSALSDAEMQAIFNSIHTKVSAVAAESAESVKDEASDEE